MNKPKATLASYIKTLIDNQNNTNTPCLQDLFSKSDYERLLNPVITKIMANPHASMSTIRLKLLEESGLKALADSLVNSQQITPGLVIDYGTFLTRDTIICGNKEEYTRENDQLIYNPKPMDIDTIFDLASTSKIFTSLAILKLEELGLLDIYQPITSYVPEFFNLNDVTVYDLLKFRLPIGTDVRLDQAKSIEEAQNILFTTKRRDNEEDNAYTDMGAMVLRYVVEKQAQMSFNDFVTEVIFKPALMQDTYLNVPSEKLERVANENYSIKVLADGTYQVDYTNFPGTPHDAKARAIGATKGISPGNAGYFSTTEDMIKLAKALMQEKIIKQESLFSIADNIVGLQNEDAHNYGWFYGSLAYLKQPDQTRLGVHHPLSGKAFLVPGFAGTTYCLDPLNQISLFVGANRLHNRIYSIHPSQTSKIKRNFINNKKTFILPNGEEKIISEDFAKYREFLVKSALDLTLQYQLLEKIYEPKKEMHLVRELD